MNSEKILIAIDFDHTLVDCNSDLYIKSLAPNSILPEDIENSSRNPEGWTPYMRKIFRFLYDSNVRSDDYHRCLSEISLVNGMKQFLLEAYSSGNFEIIVISDANSIFIQFILDHNGLHDVVKNIFTNPAEFDADGCLTIQEYQMQDWCSRCTQNICKGSVLETYLTKRNSEGMMFQKVVFIGDGRNDLCPSLKLGSDDFIFARKGYSLLRRLERMPAEDIKAMVFPWENANDIKATLLS